MREREAFLQESVGEHIDSLWKERGIRIRIEEGRRMFGTIKKIMKDKGFGFIAPDDGSDDVFFHRSRLAPKMYFEDLREGEEVEFQVKKGEKGPQAFNVKHR